MMEYRARCHCGHVRFSFRCPEIKTGCHCNCSLCVRRGAVLSSRYIPAADFTPHHAPDDLGLYLWNEKVLRNYFCKACGVFTYIGDGEEARDGIASISAASRVSIRSPSTSASLTAGRCRWSTVEAITYDDPTGKSLRLTRNSVKPLA
jgi:hypothetical protein